MEDKDFDQLFEVPEDKDYTKKVAKGMNQSIYKRILKTLLVVCLSITGLYFGTSVFISKLNYDPNSLNLAPKQYKNSFDILLLTYLQIYYPGYKFITAYGGYTPEGFGRYVGGFYKISSLEEYNPTSPQSRIEVEIDGSRLHVDFGSSKGLVAYSGYLNQQNTGEDIQHDKYILSELSELPESSRVDMMVGFTEYRTFDDIAKLISIYPELSFTWVATNTDGDYGFSLFRDNWLELNEEAQAKYPNLIISNEVPNGQEMEEHFRSSVKLLIDNPDFIELIKWNGPKQINNSSLWHDSFRNLDIFDLKSAYEQEKLYSVGINFNGKKKDVLNFLEKESVQRYSVKDVTLSFMGN